MVYGDFDGPRQRKNKPNQTQFMLAPSTAGGWKTNLKKQSQYYRSEFSVKIKKWNLKKQSQFCKSGNEHKVNYNKEL